MLKKNKTITLSGESTINDQLVARFSATVSSESSDSANSDSFNTYIYNRESYEKNRHEVRKDMNDFRQYVFKQEDELFSDVEDKTDEATTE